MEQSTQATVNRDAITSAPAAEASMEHAAKQHENNDEEIMEENKDVKNLEGEADANNLMDDDAAEDSEKQRDAAEDLGKGEGAADMEQAQDSKKEGVAEDLDNGDAENMDEAEDVDEDEAAIDVDEDLEFQEALLRSYMEHTAQMSERQQQPSDKLGQTPPAAAETIKNLPLIELDSKDLANPISRECSVCLEEFVSGETAVRLPQCGHVFHKDCILDWLQRKCTCPLCLFELPTDDAEYEQGRLERMKSIQMPESSAVDMQVRPVERVG